MYSFFKINENALLGNTHYTINIIIIIIMDILHIQLHKYMLFHLTMNWINYSFIYLEKLNRM